MACSGAPCAFWLKLPNLQLFQQELMILLEQAHSFNQAGIGGAIRSLGSCFTEWRQENMNHSAVLPEKTGSRSCFPLDTRLPAPVRFPDSGPRSPLRFPGSGLRFPLPGSEHRFPFPGSGLRFPLPGSEGDAPGDDTSQYYGGVEARDMGQTGTQGDGEPGTGNGFQGAENGAQTQGTESGAQIQGAGSGVQTRQF